MVLDCAMPVTFEQRQDSHALKYNEKRTDTSVLMAGSSNSALYADASAKEKSKVMKGSPQPQPQGQGEGIWHLDHTKASILLPRLGFSASFSEGAKHFHSN